MQSLIYKDSVKKSIAGGRKALIFLKKLLAYKDNQTDLKRFLNEFSTGYFTTVEFHQTLRHKHRYSVPMNTFPNILSVHPSLFYKPGNSE